MPRFYYHFRYVGVWLTDYLGNDHPDIQAATAYALESARRILAGPGCDNPYMAESAYAIIDDRGTVRARVAFSALARSRKGFSDQDRQADSKQACLPGLEEMQNRSAQRDEKEIA